MAKRPRLWREGAICPECGNDVLVYDPRTGEVSCPSCGYVVRERGVDRGGIWMRRRIGVGLEHPSRSCIGIMAYPRS